MTVVSFPSPNYTPGRSRPITRILIHATRGGTAPPEIERQATLNWFANPTSQASAHAVIAVDGTIYRCVADENTAWHAGDKDPALNENPGSLGVELVQARIESPFTQAQYTSLVWLVKDWCEKWLIPKDRSHILGHEETAQGIEQGKTDPGPQFKWLMFMRMLEEGTMPELDILTADLIGGYLLGHSWRWMLDRKPQSLMDVVFVITGSQEFQNRLKADHDAYKKMVDELKSRG